MAALGAGGNDSVCAWPIVLNDTFDRPRHVGGSSRSRCQFFDRSPRQQRRRGGGWDKRKGEAAPLVLSVVENMVQLPAASARGTAVVTPNTSVTTRESIKHSEPAGTVSGARYQSSPCSSRKSMNKSFARSRVSGMMEPKSVN